MAIALVSVWQTQRVLNEDMKEDHHHFDFSENPEILHNNLDKEVLVKMKDKCQGHIMRKFVGQKSKIYSFVYENKKYRKREQIHQYWENEQK